MEEKTSHKSRNSDIQRKPNSKRNHITRENPKEQYARVEDNRLCFYFYFFLIFILFSIYFGLRIKGISIIPSLLSFTPLSYIVAPERILVNILFPFDINTKTSLQESSEITNNMDIDISKGQSASSSANSSRSSTVLVYLSSQQQSYIG